MFARSSNVIVDSYSARRARKGLPRWLWLLLFGVVIGAGAVIGVQENLLPPRLSADASARITAAYEDADRERTKLRADLQTTLQQLQQANRESQAQQGSATSSQRRVSELQADIVALLDALPPDPRGGVVQVRSARFKVEGAQLVYDIVLSRDRPGDKAWPGVMQLVLTGSAGGNDNATARLAPISISIGRYASLRGSQPLPGRFDARQAGIQVLDRTQGQLMGQRLINLK